jgi:hypothetical protein
MCVPSAAIALRLPAMFVIGAFRTSASGPFTGTRSRLAGRAGVVASLEPRKTHAFNKYTKE